MVENNVFPFFATSGCAFAGDQLGSTTWNTTESPYKGHESSTISEGILQDNYIIQITLKEYSLSLDDSNLTSETLENACCSSEK